MLKLWLRYLKQTWKFALLTYMIAVIVDLLTGWTMDSIIIGIFGTILALVSIWAIYVFVKEKIS